MMPPLYKTIDIYLAAFLYAEGAKLHSYKKLRPKRTEFRFLADRELHDLLRLYWNREPALIVPFKLLAALYRLKCLAIALGRQHEVYGTSPPATLRSGDAGDHQPTSWATITENRGTPTAREGAVDDSPAHSC